MHFHHSSEQRTANSESSTQKFYKQVGSQFARNSHESTKSNVSLLNQFSNLVNFHPTDFPSQFTERCLFKRTGQVLAHHGKYKKLARAKMDA